MSEKLNKSLQSILKEGKEANNEEATKKVTSKETPVEVTIGLEVWSEESINNSVAVADLPDEEKEELKEKVQELGSSVRETLGKVDWSSKDVESMPKYWYEGTDGWVALGQGDVSKLEEYANEIIDWVGGESEESEEASEELTENKRRAHYEGEGYFGANRKIAMLEAIGTEFTHKDFDELNNNLLADFAFSKGYDFTSRGNIIDRLIESGKVCKKDITLFLEACGKKQVNEAIEDNMEDLGGKWAPEIDFKMEDGAFVFDSESTEYALLNDMEGELWEEYLEEMGEKGLTVEYDTEKDQFKVYSNLSDQFEEEEGERFPLEDEDKDIVEGIVESKKYNLVECRGALKISGKENIMEVLVEKDNHQTLIKYDDAAITKPWRIGQFEFTLLHEALDNIRIPLAKLQAAVDKKEASTSKRMLITEKVQRQSSSLSKNLPLAEKERREIRGEEISNRFIALENTGKKTLKEGTYDEFLINYGREIESAVLKLKELWRRHGAGEVSGEAIDKAFYQIANIYDKPVVDLIDNFDDTISAEEIARVGLRIQNNFGTEPKQVLNAIDDFYNNLK